MDLALNPSLDRKTLAADFARDGYVQVHDFLTEASALAVEQALRSLPWNLVYRDPRGVVSLDPATQQRLTPADAAEVRRTVDDGARSGFQFLYNCFPIVDAYFTPDRPDQAVFRAFEFLNGAPVLDLLRAVTGHDDVRWLDGQGALYQSSHFLSEHTDHSDAEPRLAAYVLGFTRDWRADWGGLLQFIDDRGDVERALIPRFNTLNLFSVPRRHAVSMVAPWSPGLRFSITGWLRADDPPAPIPHPM
jgi:SM-20-related protein